MRIGKGGKEIWLQATYNPLIDASGKPYKVVKFCSDITARKQQAADFEGQIAAINKSNAVIHFNARRHHHAREREFPGRRRVMRSKRSWGATTASSCRRPNATRLLTQRSGTR